MRSYHNHENVDCLNSALALINHPLNLAQPFIKADKKIFRIHASAEKSEMKLELEDPGSIRKLSKDKPDSVSTHSESSTLLFSKCTAHCTMLFFIGHTVGKNLTKFLCNVLEIGKHNHQWLRLRIRTYLFFYQAYEPSSSAGNELQQRTCIPTRQSSLNRKRSWRN